MQSLFGARLHPLRRDRRQGALADRCVSIDAWLRVALYALAATVILIVLQGKGN